MPPIGLPDWLYPGIVVQPIAWGNEVRTEITPEMRIQAWVTAIAVEQPSLYVHFRDFHYSPEANQFVVGGPTRTMPASEFVQVYQPRPSAYSSHNYVFSAMQEPGSLGPGAFVAQRLPLVDRQELVTIRGIMEHVGGEVFFHGVDSPITLVGVNTSDPSVYNLRLRHEGVEGYFSLELFRLHFREWGNKKVEEPPVEALEVSSRFERDWPL